MFIENLPPAEAYPIATFLIAVCSFCTYYMGVKDKVENPAAKFIDYDLAIVFCPSLLLGTKFGAILNKTLSPIFLTIFLTLFVLNNVKNSYYKANELRKKESQALQLEPKENDFLKYTLMKDHINSSPRQRFSPRKSSHTEQVEREIEENSNKLKKKFKEEEDLPIRWDRIKYLVIFLSISIADQLLEGSSKVPSLIGIQKCSFGYWFFFIVYVGVSLYLVQWARQIVKSNYEYKLSLTQELKNENIEALEKEFQRIVIFTFLGGIVTSMLGIGGGMITTPLLLRLGLDPKAATSTSNLLILFSTITGSFLFILSGQLNIGFGICLAVPCGLAALYGSKMINDLINRTKKSSTLLFILLYFLFGSFVILLITSYNRLFSSKDVGIFHLNSFCT